MSATALNRCHSFASFTGRLFAVALGLAAMAKSIAPETAASAFRSIGLAGDSAILAVIAVAGAEWLAAIYLLTSAQCRRWASAGLFVTGLLSVATGLAYGLGNREGCGCFGDVPVPGWFMTFMVLAGAAAYGTALLLERGRPLADSGVPPLAGTRLRLLLVLAFAFLLMWRQPWSNREANEAARRHCEESKGRGRHVFVSSRCPDCRSWISRHSRRIGAGDSGSDGPTTLVFGEADTGRADLVRRYPGVAERVIPMLDWWAIVKTGPPVIVICRDGRPSEISRP